MAIRRLTSEFGTDLIETGDIAAGAITTEKIVDTTTVAALACGTTINVVTVTTASTTALIVGMTVSGTEITAGTTIATIPDATSFTLSAVATATNGTASLTFESGITSNKIAASAVTKTSVGLGNVDNTTDALKPVSTVVAASLVNIRQDLNVLALKQAVQEDSAKFNLPNSAITKFESAADYDAGGSTTITLDASEYISTTASAQTLIAHGTGTDSFSSAATSNDAVLRDGDTTKTKGEAYQTVNAGDFISYGVDWGVGNTKTITGFKVYGPTDDGIHTAGGANGYVRLVGSATAIVPTISNGTQLHQVTTQPFTAFGFTYSVLSGITTTTAYRYHYMWIESVYGAASKMYVGEHQWYEGDPSFQPTGTALGTTNVPSSAVTEVSGVMLLKHAYGTNTLGTAAGGDIKVYFTVDNSTWTEASSYTDAGTFSTGIKMIKLGKTTFGSSGSDVRWKVVWAAQVASTKEAHIYGIGINY